MNNKVHPFDIIQEWGNLSEDELIDALDKPGARTALISAAELLLDKPIDINEYSIDDLPQLLKKLRQLIRNCSWELGKAIIKSSDLARAGDLNKAIDVMNNYKASCISPFYNKQADGYIRGLKNKF